MEEVKEYIESLIERSSEYLHLLPGKFTPDELAEEVENYFIANSNDNFIYIVNLSEAASIRLDQISFLRSIAYLLSEYQRDVLSSFKYETKEAVIYFVDSAINYTVQGVYSYKRKVTAFKVVISSNNHIPRESLEK